MRKIQRSKILAALSQLTGNRPHTDQLDVELFHLFDDREVRLQRRTIGRFIQEGIPNQSLDPVVFLHHLQATEYVAPAIVSPYYDSDDDFRDGALTNAPKEIIGFTGDDGVFVPLPNLSLLPRYCSSMGAARTFKWDAFGALVYLAWREFSSEWDTHHSASLVDDAGSVVAEFTSDTPATAIVGAVLTAMISGWTHKLMGFEIEDD